MENNHDYSSVIKEMLGEEILVSKKVRVAIQWIRARQIISIVVGILLILMITTSYFCLRQRFIDIRNTLQSIEQKK